MGWLARSVSAVLDAAGAGRAVVVGHSNGVPVARQLQRQRPETVEGLVAVDGPFRMSIPQARPIS
jgi:pimeloyl-ACP methyl ester carboxylesterase